MACVPNSADSGNDESSGTARSSRRERVRDWIRGRRERLEEARGTSATVGFAFDALSYDTDTGAPVLAAALGYRVFLFQVPYVCVFVIVAGFLADMTGRDITSFFHGQGIPQLTAQAVSGAAEFSGWTRISALALTAYALFLSSRAFVKVMNIAYALVWDVRRTRLAHANRSALAFIGLLTLFLALSFAIVTLREHSTIGGVISLILYTVALFGLGWYASWWLPHRDCPLIALVPGAVLFAVLLEVLHVITVVWLPHHLENKSQQYGTIGVAVGLLLWAYLLGRVITLAAVLNAALWARFGWESAHPIQLRRPSWRVPLLDDRFGRIWIAVFGDDQPSTTEQQDHDKTKRPEPPTP
jgi:uncharacterized BrkB/YihY/UPF0761 family membrane protein